MHSPWGFRCEDRAFRHHHRCTTQLGGEEAGEAAAGEFPKQPWSVSFSLFVFENFFLLKPATLYKEVPVLSHSPPLLLEQGLSRSGPIMSQLSTLPSRSPQSPSLFPSLRLQATRSFLVLLKPCLAREGAIDLALSQESCGRPGSAGPGAAATLVPTLVLGPY